MSPRVLDDRYRLDAELGRGGMAVVFRGHDLLLDRPVAVKLLRALDSGDEGWRRLLAEAQSAARLNHPNIVAIYDVGEDRSSGNAPQPYIVMELVEGRSLHEKPPTDLETIVRIASGMLEGLGHAHAHGVIHRDLKPENVLLTPGGGVKLMDFGLAQSMSTRMSQSGVLIGTVYYVAPEQAMGREVDGRADLYALGVMLYEMVAGRLPFSAESALAVISLHLNAPVVPPSAHRPDLPPALEDLILDLLAKRPEDRPADTFAAQRRLKDSLTAPTTGSAERSILERIVRGRLIGRERELSETLEHWNHAAKGEGEVLLVTGEPGIGKTRLVREVVAHVEATGGRVLSGECYAEGGVPFAPVAEAIRRGLSGLGPDALPDFVVAELVTFAPDLALRFPGLPSNPSLDTANQQQRAFEAFTLYCEAVAGGAPLAIFLDDIHWADAGTIQLIHHLARRIRRQPILLILTYREIELDENPPLSRLLTDLNRERLAVRVKLGRLTREQTNHLLQAMFTEEITPDFLDGIYRESEGNPFFIEEICKALVDSGKLRFEAGRWHRPGVADLEIPQSVRGAILSRIDKLPEPAQEAMLMASILGREFEFTTLQRATDMPEVRLIEALEAAEHAQLISETRHNGDVMFTFLHALIPASLTESVSVLRRKLLHRRAAEAIEAIRPDSYEILSYHWIEAGEDEKARRTSLQAAERAYASLARAEAVRFFQAALERWPHHDLTGRAATLAKLGDSLQVAGADGTMRTYVESRDLYERLGDPIGTGDAERRIGRLYYEVGNRKQALEHYHRALHLLEQGPPTPALAFAVSSISQMHMLASEYDDAIRWGERAMALAAETGAEQVRIHALNNVGTSYIGIGQVERGRDMLEQSAEDAIEAGFVHDACRAYMNIASSFFALGRYNDAVPVYRDMIAFCERYHVPGFVTAAQLELSGTLWRTGEWRDALALDREVLQSAYLAGLTEVWRTALRAMMETDLGRPEQAHKALLEVRERILAEMDEPQSVFPQLIELIRSGGLVGDHAAAGEAIRNLLDRIDSAPTTHADAAIALLEAIRWQSSASIESPVDDPAAYLERIQRVQKQHDVPRTQACTREAQAILAIQAGDFESGAELAGRAAAAWEQTPCPYAVARCLEIQARAMMAAGRRPEAVEPLRTAESLLRKLETQLEPEDLATFRRSDLFESVQTGLGQAGAGA